MSNTIQITGKTDTGKRRSDNQDSFICKPLWSQQDALLAVIDGVGGYAGGDIAAAIAREAISQYMTVPKGDPLTMLREAVVFANNQIAEERAENALYAQMCCVLTAAVANTKTKQLLYVHVGDTRLYRLRNGQLEKITKDHSLVGMREDAGELTEAEAMRHPRRNEILREVGSVIRRIGDSDFIDFGQTDFLPGDQLLICSDGLTDMVTAAPIIEVLNKTESLALKADALIALANDNGGNDNITVVLAQNAEKKKADQRKITAQPTATPAIPSPTTGAKEIREMAIPVDVPDNAAAKKNAPSLVKWLLAASVLVNIGLLVFISMRQKTGEAKPTSPGAIAQRSTDSVAATAPNGYVLPDSVLKNAITTPQRVLQLNTLPAGQSVTLASPITLGNLLSVQGVNKDSLIIISPAGGYTNGTAFDVQLPDTAHLTKKDTIRLKNLIIKDFETGIRNHTQLPVVLENVHFENVKNKLVHEISDSSKNIFLIKNK